MISSSSVRARWAVAVLAILAIAVVAVAVAVGRMLLTAPREEVIAVSSDAADPAIADPYAQAVEPIFVHVSGAVQDPGVYALSSGARVIDAVTAAGGFADEADRSRVNLAREPVDGEQIHIPLIGEAPPAGSAGPSGPAGDALVNLNTASAETLQTLPGIGPALSARIVAWWEANGAFTSPEQLLEVPGIGAKLLHTLLPLVTL